MPLDAVVLSGLRRELEQTLVGGRIDKIYQPERDEIILNIRGRGENLRLLFSANPTNARVHTGRMQRDNPQTPPMFCMLMRKLFSGGIIRDIYQPPMERILEFTVDTVDELGSVLQRKIVFELIGRMSNLILLDDEGRIVDSLRRIDTDITDRRQILPGMFYRYPPTQEKANPLETSIEQISSYVESSPPGMRADKWILETFFGIPPLIAREIAFRSTGDVSPTFYQMDEMKKERFASALCDLFILIKSGDTTPYMLLDGEMPYDISYMPITQYDSRYTNREYESFSLLVETFFEKRAASARVKQQVQALGRVVSPVLDRVRRKVENQKKELLEAKDREKLRKYGDLLMANLNSVPRGARTARVVNFYDLEGGLIDIPLDPRLSVQQNAAKYYKDYNRMKTAERVLAEQIQAGENEIQYLESVLDMLRRVESTDDIEELREELKHTGYLRSTDKRRSKKSGQTEQRPPQEFRTSGGFTVLCGRNNLQNDRLTLKYAHKNDIWFHVQKIPGSHVILRTEGKEPDDQTYTEAAMIAAVYSQAHGGQNVSVDYTRVRYVKKPPGSKPGVVIYDPYFTAYVTPDKEAVDKLRI
jgi:predicted ribosome quality control (RQC) complex YloA/Tae2 family protein